MNSFILFRVIKDITYRVFVQILLSFLLLCTVFAGDDSVTATGELPVIRWTRFRPDVVVKDYTTLFKNTPGTGYDTSYRVLLDSTDTPSSYSIAERRKEIIPIECPHHNLAYLSPAPDRDSLYFKMCTGFDSSENSGTLPMYLHLVGNGSRKYTTGMPYAEIGPDYTTYLDDRMKDDIGIWFASSAKYNVKFKESVIKESATPFQQKVIDAIILKEMKEKNVVRMTGDSLASLIEGAIGVFPLGVFEGTTSIVVNIHYFTTTFESDTYVFDFGENGCVYERIYSYSGDFGAAWFISAYTVVAEKKPDIIVLAQADRAGYCTAITIPLGDGLLGYRCQRVIYEGEIY